VLRREPHDAACGGNLDRHERAGRGAERERERRRAELGNEPAERERGRDDRCKSGARNERRCAAAVRPSAGTYNRCFCDRRIVPANDESIKPFS
jgi:hypothetical protein